MIISPARFEDAVNKIISSENDDRWTKLLKLDDLTYETLDSLGYGAGVKALNDWVNNDN